MSFELFRKCISVGDVSL